jgi:hypothetical protein
MIAIEAHLFGRQTQETHVHLHVTAQYNVYGKTFVP